MKPFLFLLGLWAVGDAIWLALQPQAWSNWWGRWVLRLGANSSAARAYALFEFVLGAAFVVWAIGRPSGAREEMGAPRF
jgi:hypothetical protein